MGMIPYDARSTVSRYSSCSEHSTTIHAFRSATNEGVSSRPMNDIRVLHLKQTCLKKNLNAPRPSEHPPVWGEKAIVKEGALVSPKGSHWARPEKYRSTVCQSGPSKRAQRSSMG